jgi:fibronectin type 3 domain-containing protein
VLHVRSGGGGARTTFNNTGLTPATSYSYRVRATDAAGNLSGYSATVSATTSAAATYGTITFVQVKSATPKGSPTSVAVAFTSAQTAGNLNVVAIGWGETTRTISSVTDSKGNSYVLAAPLTRNTNGGLSHAIYYAKNIAAAAAGTNTVTVTFSGGASDPDLRILEYRGADASTPVDVTSTGTGSGTTSTTPAVTTTTPSDLLFAANVVTTKSTAAGTGFTSRIITPDGNIAEDRMVTAVGSYTATATLNSGQWIAQVVAFRAALIGPDTTPPSVPAGLAATAVSSTQINLSWTASTDNVGVTGYRVERCQGAGCATFAQILTPTTTSVSDTTAAIGTSYSYRVLAVDAAGNVSGYSNVASATTPAPDTTLPTAPGTPTATPISSSAIDLTWPAATDNVGVTAYLVERCVTASCVFAQIATPASTSFNDTGLPRTRTTRTACVPRMRPATSGRTRRPSARRRWAATRRRRQRPARRAHRHVERAHRSRVDGRHRRGGRDRVHARALRGYRLQYVLADRGRRSRRRSATSA